MDRALSEFTNIREVNPTAHGSAGWVAQNPASGQTVLIKRLDGAAGKTRATQALGLSHRHIAATRRWLLDSQKLYVVRDWVEGQNLRERLAQGASQTFPGLRRLLDPLVEAIEYAQGAGVPHGAITPENVVLDKNGRPIITDYGVFDPRNGARARYIPRQLLSADGKPTTRSDFYSLYELYKEFLPERFDEAGVEARNRIIRNLSEAQLSTATPDEMRYKLDAITRMADLLGFGEGDGADGRASLGARLVCQLSPPTAVVNPGSGTTVVLTVWNEGEQPLRIERVASDAVWLNPQSRFEPIMLAPDDECDLVLTVSAARLGTGAHTATISIFSNSGLAGLTPSSAERWHEQTVSLPVLVQGPASVPIAERLPAGAPEKGAAPPLASPQFGAASSAVKIPPAQPSADAAETPGIACIQEPDPGVVKYGQTGVLNVGVRNIGDRRIRIDRVSTWPGWLTYPGEFQPVWIEPGATQYLGFSVAGGSLTVGDYKAGATFVTSLQEETGLGSKTIWREMKCEVRVRVTKIGEKHADGGGCAIMIMSVLGFLGVLTAGIVSVLR